MASNKNQWNQIVAHHYNGYKDGDEYNVWFVCHSCNISLGNRTDLTRYQAQRLISMFEGKKGYLRQYLAQGLSCDEILLMNHRTIQD
jgi:hypothetical protein